MKLFITAALAATLALSGSMAFAQASGAMANDSMSKDSMAKDSMSKDSMSKDTMKKSDKMKKEGGMGMDHKASGAMAQ
jgi:pentapeptide MXKDX repeat protein